jgi:4-hydroxybenzoate polyprenyltransferase
MIAILLATRAEAIPLLQALHAEKLAETPFETHWFAARRRRPAGLVVITGMGPVATTAAVRHVCATHSISHLINIGICGSLRNDVEPGSVYRITSAADGDANPSPPLPLAAIPTAALKTPDSPWHAWRTARLVSVAEPVFGGQRRSLFSASADLVDMEGYAVASEAAAQGVPCTLLKGVSDQATEGGREDLQRNLQPVSKLLANSVLSDLEHWPRSDGSLTRRLANFVKVEHTLFSLPLLFAGAWLGSGGHMPSLRVLLLVTLAGLGARTLGMAMNRLLDRRLDLLNPRTAGRELPNGRMTPFQARCVAAAGLLVYGLACASLGQVCLSLSPIPAAVLIGYSLLKRFTPFCHFGIGLALALGPLCAYVAATGHAAVDLSAILLAAFTFLWISGFDIIYALQDLGADLRNGVHSLPVALGSRGAQIVAALLHTLAAAFAVALWRMTGGGWVAAVPLAAVIGAFVAAYDPRLPLPVRFFPVSAIAGIAGALIPLLGGLP